MMIVGFNLEKIEAERKQAAQGKVEIKHDLQITGMDEEKTPVKTEQGMVRVGFEYRVNYDPKVGNVNLKGHLLYLADQKKAKELVAEWKKDKKITDSNVFAQIFNAISTRANIRALTLSQDVGLPPQIRLPKIVPKESGKSYIG